MQKQLDGTTQVEDGTYTVQEDGSICIIVDGSCKEGSTIPVEVEGERPDKDVSWIKLENGKVTCYHFVISGETIEKPTDSGTGGKEYTQVYKPQYYGDYSFSGTVGTTSAPAVADRLTTPPTGKNVYLGYDVADDKISAGYVCFIRNGNEYCLKGNNLTDEFTKNSNIIKDAYKEVADTDACNDGGLNYGCNSGGLNASTNCGTAIVARDAGWVCHLVYGGNFGCDAM